MHVRPDRHESFLAQAAVIADRSTCLRRHIGAIIVDPNNHQISSGYNGAPAGAAHCATCMREEYGIEPGRHYDLCRSCHAEMNALLQAGRDAAGATLYLVSKDAKTGAVVCQLPCHLCAKMIINAGISRVIILDEPDRARSYLEWDPVGIYLLRDEEMMNDAAHGNDWVDLDDLDTDGIEEIS